MDEHADVAFQERLESPEEKPAVTASRNRVLQKLVFNSPSGVFTVISNAATTRSASERAHPVSRATFISDGND